MAATGGELVTSLRTAEQRRFETISRHFNPPAYPIQSAFRGVGAEVCAGEFVKDEQYSVVLPEKLSDGKWNVYRNSRFPTKLVDSLPQAHIKTLHDNVEYAVATYPDEPCLGTRVRPDGSVGSYEWMSYREMGEARTAIGSGLVQKGFPKGARVGMYMANRPEWVLVEQSCYSFGFISVPLYDTLGPDAVRYIINHAEVSVVFCTRDKLQVLTECASSCPSLQLLVVIGGPSSLIPVAPAGSGLSYISYTHLESQGKINPPPFSPLTPEELCCICYTSGTTGVPKGAMLTQKGMVSSMAGMITKAEIHTGDVHISYLPLAHIYERLNIQLMIYTGSAIGFYQGDVLKLMEDIEVLRPTIFTSVPRLYNRIYDRIMATVKASGGIREYLFNVAYQAKKRAIDKGKSPSPIWDRLVFNKMKAKLGGRIRFMITGASPISPQILEFLRICFGCQVKEGYGMTETTCTISLVDDGDDTFGHVGSPSPACEVKLVDVPEMNYSSSDKPNPRGEICVRGHLVFAGYYKDPEQTKEVIDEDGWLHTGDIGTWISGGRLKIIDRKKNIFKLAQGEYVAPEKIENVYQRSPFIAQCFVHGDSLNSSLVAVVVVDPEPLQAWAKSQGIANVDDVSSLCQDKAVRDAVLADMDTLGQEAQFRGFEFVKAIHLTAEPFTLEAGILTPTFKIKRPQARARFSGEIAKMYAELELQPQSKL